MWKICPKGFGKNIQKQLANRELAKACLRQNIDLGASEISFRLVFFSLFLVPDEQLHCFILSYLSSIYFILSLLLLSFSKIIYCTAQYQVALEDKN